MIVNGTDFSYTPGVVMARSHAHARSNLAYVSSTDQWVQDEGLSVNFGGATLTPVFDVAIANLSQTAAWMASTATLPSRGPFRTAPWKRRHAEFCRR